MVTGQFLPLPMSFFFAVGWSLDHHDSTTAGSPTHSAGGPEVSTDSPVVSGNIWGELAGKTHQKPSKSSGRDEAGIRGLTTCTENHGPEKQSPKTRVPIPGYPKQALRIDYPKQVPHEFSHPPGACSRLARHSPKKGRMRIRYQHNKVGRQNRIYVSESFLSVGVVD